MKKQYLIGIILLFLLAISGLYFYYNRDFYFNDCVSAGRTPCEITTNRKGNDGKKIKIFPLGYDCTYFAKCECPLNVLCDCSPKWVCEKK